MILRIGLLIALASAACKSSREPILVDSPERPRVALVVLDGFGVRDPAPDNAIRAALDERPRGFLARAILRGEYPMLTLGASGECVGLEKDQIGNSQAGHNAICAGQPIVQRRRYIDDVIREDRLGGESAIRDAMADAKARAVPLHVVAYLADASSAGYWEHTKATLRLAAEVGVPEVYVHAICDGRGERTCDDKLRELQGFTVSISQASFATVLGRSWCLDRLGLEETRDCSAALLGEWDELPEPTTFEVVAKAIADDPALQATLPPTPIQGGKRIAPDDVVILQLYRRDVSEGVQRGLRQRDPGAAPTEAGPTVVTFGMIDDRERYEDDAFLIEGFTLPRPEALFHERLREAGIRQLRVAERKKSGHVTYFCDRQRVVDGDDFRRYHPHSISKTAALKSPCLSTLESVEHALGAMRLSEVEFVLMNLPNADILGHTGNYDAAVAAVKCLDRQLEYFVNNATRMGWHVFVTGDHGNADTMELPDGTPNVNHSISPVPFIAVSAWGQPPLRLRDLDEPACVGRTAWTVLDALGLAPKNGATLLAH